MTIENEQPSDPRYIELSEHQKLEKHAAQLESDNKRMRELITKLRHGIAFLETAVETVCEKYMPEDR